MQVEVSVSCEGDSSTGGVADKTIRTTTVAKMWHFVLKPNARLWLPLCASLSVCACCVFTLFSVLPLSFSYMESGLVGLHCHGHGAAEQGDLECGLVVGLHINVAGDGVLGQRAAADDALAQDAVLRLV